MIINQIDIIVSLTLYYDDGKYISPLNTIIIILKYVPITRVLEITFSRKTRTRPKNFHLDSQEKQKRTPANGPNPDSFYPGTLVQAHSIKSRKVGISSGNTRVQMRFLRFEPGATSFMAFVSYQSRGLRYLSSYFPSLIFLYFYILYVCMLFFFFCTFTFWQSGEISF